MQWLICTVYLRFRITWELSLRTCPGACFHREVTDDEKTRSECRWHHSQGLGSQIEWKKKPSCLSLSASWLQKWCDDVMWPATSPSCGHSWTLCLTFPTTKGSPRSACVSESILPSVSTSRRQGSSPHTCIWHLTITYFIPKYCGKKKHRGPYRPPAI